MVAHVWSGKDPGKHAEYLKTDPVRGTDSKGRLLSERYNDFANFRWLGARLSRSAVFSHKNFGKWQCIEAHVRLNDSNANNGIFQVFINNRLEISHRGIDWIGPYREYGINAVFFENYWNNGSPKTQSRYIDNIIISTSKIGCGTR